MNLNKKSIKNPRKKQKIFSKKHYQSGDGMLTTVWGPNLWHYLHTLSFNYPTNPTLYNKKYYKQFITNLQHTLPCKHCRNNLKENFKCLPLNSLSLKNRENFSRYIYQLHELINKRLNKVSNLSYSDIRDRYELFRSRCNTANSKKKIFAKTQKKKIKEKGCIDPLYGKKSKCIISIVPQNKRKKTLTIDNKCLIGGKPKI